MPSLKAHTSSKTTKMLLIGNPGSGKSGALASLVQAGYNLRILDFDNGLDVLANLLGSGKYGKPEELLSKVEYKTITDPFKNSGGKLIPAKATVWTRTASMLQNWEDGETKLGSITTWTPQDVLVIDSLTLLSKAALNYILSMNGRLGGAVEQSHWYQAQQLVESLLEMLYDEGVNCNVIVISHITYIESQDGTALNGYPMTLGKALSPKVGRYFNSILMARSSGQGTSVKRKLHTTTQAMVELKNTNPTKVPDSYPLETGLAQYFSDVRNSPAGGEKV